MSKLILCTTGTSVASGCPSLRELQGHLSHWTDEASRFEEELLEKISKIDYRDDREARRRLSAELNTLDRMDIGKGDRIVLLSTDSAPGRICSEALSGIIEEVWETETEIRRIEGMQVYDAKRLREEGLKNLVKTVLGYLDNDDIRYGYDDIILNPTGGYKAIVPFLTVLGMLYGRKAVYLFEHSNELIELPPLPLTFDLHIFERVKEALKYVEQESAVTPEAYFSRIVGFDPAERDLFLSFTEPLDDRLITLSPLAFVLLKIEESGEACMVSDAVRKTIDEARGEKKEILERMIDNSSNPLWRQQKMHRWPNSQILIIKPGNTAERIAGFMKNNRFHIALAFDSHDDYEKELGKYDLDRLRQMHYTPWEKKRPMNEVPIGMGQSIELGDEERRKFLDEIDKLKRALEKIEGERYAREKELLHSAEEMEKRLKTISENMAMLEEEKRKHLAALNVREAEIRGLERRLAEMGREKSVDEKKRKGERNRLHGLIERVKSDYAHEKEKVEKLSEKISKKEKKIDRIKRLHRESLTRISELEEKISIIKDKAKKKLKKLKKRAKKKITVLEKRNEKLSKEITKLDEKLKKIAKGSKKSSKKRSGKKKRQA